MQIVREMTQLVTRNKIPASESESESAHSKDSELEPKSSSSTESDNMDSELSDSRQSMDSEYHTCDDTVEKNGPNRGEPDRSSEGGQESESKSSMDSNEEPDQRSSSYEYLDNNIIDADLVPDIEDQDRLDIYKVLDYIFKMSRTTLQKMRDS